MRDDFRFGEAGTSAPLASLLTTNTALRKVVEVVISCKRYTLSFGLQVVHIGTSALNTQLTTCWNNVGLKMKRCHVWVIKQLNFSFLSCILFSDTPIASVPCISEVIRTSYAIILQSQFVPGDLSTKICVSISPGNKNLLQLIMDGLAIIG